MGPSRIWLPTLMATCLVFFSHYAEAQIERTMRHFCSGSSNGHSETHSPDRFNDLKMIYQNCTRIYGNVEITNLPAKNIKDQEIDFLDDIEEVKGYILIFNTELKRISFKNLKIVWGDDLFSGTTAISIQGNKHMQVVSMPNLRSIDKGALLYHSSPNLCHLNQTVNPNDFLNFEPWRMRTTNEEQAIKCNAKKRPAKCHPSCNGYCWGPLAEDCQSIYRSNSPELCESKQSYLDTAVNQTKCCHSQCIAGCYGPTSKECNYCTNFMQCKEQDGPNRDCRCVEQCTSMRKYNPKTGQVEQNPDGYYSLDNRHCEKQCPIERLVQDDVCVEHCGPGMYYDPNKGDKICRKCDGTCPKTCKFEQALTSANIQELVNCTSIEGYIKIMKNYLTEHDQRVGETNQTITIPAMKVEDLNILKDVRHISEYLFVASDDWMIRSLSFLDNLEVIEGRNLFGARQALIISKNDNLEYLGLRRLKRIDKGDVIISMNSELCFTNTFNWTNIAVGANATVAIKQNREKGVCEMEEKLCHHSCDPAFGCWGPSNADCRNCSNWLQEGRCVDKCNIRGFFENKLMRTCERCYVECDTCDGPEATDCKTCRGYRLMVKPGASSAEFDLDDDDDDVKKEPAQSDTEEDTTNAALDNTLPPAEQDIVRTQLTCVPDCPGKRFYTENGECKRCHRTCFDEGCTGPSSLPGTGGCDRCRFAVVEKAPTNSTLPKINRCLYNSPRALPREVCLNNDLYDHFPQVPLNKENVIEYECAPCDDECHKCRGKGTSRIVDECKCKNFVAIVPMHPRQGADKDSEHERVDERCVSACIKPRGPWVWGMYLDNSTVEEGVAGVCRMCSPNCDKTGEGPFCTGGTNKDCVRCAGNAFAYKFKDDLTCVKNCSELGLFTYNKDRTCNEIDYETRDRIHRAVLYILGALFLVVVIIIGLMLYRRQKRLSKELEQEKVANNPEMPELIPMDFNGGAKINREKFLLISGNELSRSAKELGRGAFGVVYAGCWMPPYQKKSGKPMKVPVAIKVVRDPSGKAQSEMLDEALKMTMLKHENLLRIVGVCLSGEDLQLVTLLRPLGNLREFLQKHKGNLSGKDLLGYSYQIASGMKYLTDHRVVHRDLAARNVLVKNIHHVEITDFGLAKLIDIGSDSVQVGEGKVAIKWLAIEALEKQVYNSATDVWAFGVTVWEILTYGESPYANMTPMTIKEYLLQGQRLAQPNNCSTELYKILIDCWLPKPDSRPTFACIKDILYRYCRAPYVFVIEPDVSNGIELDNYSQRGLIEEILDETDFEDPQNYFDSEPNTPGCHNPGDIFNPTGVRRMDSLGSQRYAQDPTTRPKEFGMADDNYLVPNSHAAEMGATMYTPVVVDESGNSSLVESLGYYNEVKPGAEYINDTQALKKSIRSSRDDRLSMIEEDEDAMEKESCL